LSELGSWANCWSKQTRLVAYHGHQLAARVNVALIYQQSRVAALKRSTLSCYRICQNETETNSLPVHVNSSSVNSFKNNL